jgi:Uma2 family endonuclease
MSAILQYPHRHPVSAQEFLRMGEAGVFAPDARLELIEGEIVESAPIASPHSGMVNLLNRLFTRLDGDRALVSVQNPLVIADRSVAQPDLALLKPRADNYSRSHPNAGDVLLVLEVSDATLRFDLEVKVPLYARSGIAEAWVIDLPDRALRVFRDPGADGYRTRIAAKGEESITVLLLPDVAVSLPALFQ